MGSVGTPVIRRIVQVGRGPERPEDLLASVGIHADAPVSSWAGESVDAEAYYGLIERVAGAEDHALPFRYAEALQADDFGALGLAMKTAQTLGATLQRLMRYILVLSDTLEYALVDEPGGQRFELNGRPHHRRGAALANECALAAVVSMLRQAAGAHVRPDAVSFRHPRPPTVAPHQAFFGCDVAFDAAHDAIHLSAAVIAQQPRLADAGLSAYLLARLDELRARAADRSLVSQVRGAVADALPDGQPSKTWVARRLGMSERTLHRRLADEGASFQAIATQVRREAAEALLVTTDHPLADVAFLTGFADQSAFTRAFKRWTGLTPTAYRVAGARTADR
ncbi:AraC family transcriptional regulator ligand-binding domain-containing protein [Euzebya rosea]|uniref:AraC family transcriptional regulator ligand-binding domain-containing protein n=1 Tax=Euzebya rosea TaxID=2052804 RepID=UPI000D3E9F71